MALSDTIYRLRSGANMSEERFGEIVGVSSRLFTNGKPEKPFPKLASLLKFQNILEFLLTP